MGRVGEVPGPTMATKKRKKKGRPSLLDIQKRTLKQEQKLQRNPNSKNPNVSFDCIESRNRRSIRRNTITDGNSAAQEWIGAEDDDDERKEKKQKPLIGLNLQNHNLIHGAYGSNSDMDIENLGADLKRKRIADGSPVESGPTTPLPDKKLLVFILDRIQKKDTYGVFSEPVDPEELPDYHDIVEHPMDFSTVRKKLDGGAYSCLEQFEKDVFLICSNAMQYNEPDTIYFRQARSIQGLAKKDFENLRQDSDDGEPQPKVVRKGRPAGKGLKKSLERSLFDRVGPEFSSDATLASGGDIASWSNGYNLRKSTASKSQPADVSVWASRGSHSGENHATWSSEWEKEFPASVVRAVMKHGKKHFAVDENKRATYKHPVASEPSVWTTFDGELDQLVPVGVGLEHGYARSLARFAADLGPAVWKVVSKKIESVLPFGLGFGPGWVGDDKVEECLAFLPSENRNVLDKCEPEHHVGGLPQSCGANSIVASRFFSQTQGDMKEGVAVSSSQGELNSLDDVNGVKHVVAFQNQQKPVIHSNMNGFSGGFGYNHLSPTGTLRIETLTENSSFEAAAVPAHSMPGNDFASSNGNLTGSFRELPTGNSLSTGSGFALQTVTRAAAGQSSRQGLSRLGKQESPPFSPDLNVGFLAPSSPGTNVLICSPQQPDLALQL
ncbi:bromodomain-containing protein [Tripterygium wilfordii]|uniref:Bromodomain-containing protein n=1 Tax=Tripterygium wilfordii TaxID=458696 RepID=A0A7J7D3X4_TRIWF|nr:bromodomain-containing protein [Tripterygium wilfordii]